MNPEGPFRLYQLASKALYVLAALLLLVLSLLLVGIAAVDVVRTAIAGDVSVVTQILHSIGLVIISVAVFDMAKYLIEEEVARTRELRSSYEARRSLTKFMTIIVIATSLEALVTIFEAGEKRVEMLIYPATLLAAAVFALIGLSIFQWLSRASEQTPTPPKQEADDGR